VRQLRQDASKPGGPNNVSKISIRRPARFAAIAVVALVVGAALASAGFAGLRALDLGPAAAQQYPRKVTLCHRTHSKKHRWVKIRVSRHAVKAHLRHGDFVVDASHPCPPTSDSARKHKHHKHHKHHKNHKHGKNADKKKHGHVQAGKHNGGKGDKHGDRGKHGKK
jgi:hypothetical protein